MPLCKYCSGSYASQGSLTRHLTTCPERQLHIKHEETKTLVAALQTREYEIKAAVQAKEAELKETHRKEQARIYQQTFERECKLQQDMIDRENRLRVEAAATHHKLEQAALAREKKLVDELKHAQPVINNNFTNCTFNVVVTQQYIVQHNKAIEAFCHKLTQALSDKRWTSLTQVKAGMKQLVNAINQDNADSRKMLEYLRSPDVEVAVEDQVDGQAVVNNLKDKVDGVDKQMVIFAKRHLSVPEQAILDLQLKKQSIWSLE